MNRFNPERIDHWLLLSIIPLSLIFVAILYGFSRQVLMLLGLFRYEFFVILALFCMVVLGVIQKRRWDNQLKKSKQSENTITLDETPKKPAYITGPIPQLQTPQPDQPQPESPIRDNKEWEYAWPELGKIYTYNDPTKQMSRAEKAEAYLDWIGQDPFFKPDYDEWAIIKFNGTDTCNNLKVCNKTLLGWKTQADKIKK